MPKRKQRTIPIKKADGTIERITLAEFKERQKNQPSKNPPEKKMAEAPKEVAPPVNPASPKIKPAPLAKKKDDYNSLLEEPFPGNKKSTAPILSDNRLPEVEKIFKKLKFRAPQPERLKNIIQARLKDVRDSEATKQKLTANVNQGGAGLKPDQAEEVLRLCRMVMGQIAAGGVDTTPRMKPQTTPIAKKPLSVQQKPAKDMFVEQRSMSGNADDISSLIKKTSTPPMASQPAPASMKRPVMQDVSPGKASQMGPVEEVGNFSLVDFRRLSAKPAEAAARLKQKFIVLQDESYLFYLRALSAWYKSPLYRSYMDKVVVALNSQAKLEDVLTDADGIKMTEIQSLINMEKELN